MNKSGKILLLVGCGLLFTTSIVLFMFYRRATTCGGFAFLCLGLGFILLGINNRYEYQQKINELDDIMEELRLADEEDAESDGQLFDEKQENKAIKKVYRQMRKDNRTHVGLFFAGVVFIFVALLVF